MKLLRTSLCLLLITLPSATPWADELTDLKQQQAQLEQMLQAIEQAEQERLEQRQTLQRLQKQLACNWQLIRAYEQCEQLYANDPEAKLSCSSTAKAEAKHCLTK